LPTSICNLPGTLSWHRRYMAGIARRHLGSVVDRGALRGRGVGVLACHNTEAPRAHLSDGDVAETVLPIRQADDEVEFTGGGDSELVLRSRACRAMADMWPGWQHEPVD
jgi:hypothetical protein